MDGNPHEVHGARAQGRVQRVWAAHGAAEARVGRAAGSADERVEAYSDARRRDARLGQAATAVRGHGGHLCAGLDCSGVECEESKEPVFSVSFATYEKLLRTGSGSATSRTSGSRHTLPAMKGHRLMRTISKVKERGLWLSPASVARYKKAGTLMRQNQLISAVQLQHAQQVRSRMSILVAHPRPP